LKNQPLNITQNKEGKRPLEAEAHQVIARRYCCTAQNKNTPEQWLWGGTNLNFQPSRIAILRRINEQQCDQ
jgi:hypothetical protein